jgi:hypothetical protein
LDILGLDKNNFGLHSLRAGGATNAARLLKKTHGRWKTDNAKDGYVREDLKSLLSVSMNLGI